MFWLIIAKLFVLFIGIVMIYKGIKLTKDEHKKEEYIGSIATYNASLIQTIVLFIISLLLKLIPWWLMQIILVLIGVCFILLGIFVIPLK
ncbi:hypothetical protein [Peribacillus frigoritolerans]|uniref:hypothetical protein n=1 Tax=Peribacillus castrilensis TaxID=2897690 RepID=UPI003DA37DDD